MRILVLLIAATLSTQAFALGDREKGVLMGIFGAVAVNKIMQANENNSPYYIPNVHGINMNTNGEFPPFRCRGQSVECSYQRGVWEREHQKWQEAKQRAYDCGRYGRCE